MRSEKREAPKVAPGPLLRRRQCLRTEGLSPPCQSSKRSKLSPDLSSVPRSANTASHVCADFIPSFGDCCRQVFRLGLMLRDALALTSPDAPSPDWSNPLIGTSFPLSHGNRFLLSSGRAEMGIILMCSLGQPTPNASANGHHRTGHQPPDTGAPPISPSGKKCGCSRKSKLSWYRTSPPRR